MNSLEVEGKVRGNDGDVHQMNDERMLFLAEVLVDIQVLGFIKDSQITSLEGTSQIRVLCGCDKGMHCFLPNGKILPVFRGRYSIH